MSTELTTPEAHCNNLEANQPLPNLPAGQVEGGSSEFVDGKIYQCDGSNVNIYDKCYSLDLGAEKWEEVQVLGQELKISIIWMYRVTNQDG